MPDELEERVRKLELRLAFAAGAALVLTISVLALFGVTNWYSIPRAVERKVNEIVGQEVIDRVRAADREAQSLLSNASRIGEERDALNSWASYELPRALCSVLPEAGFDVGNLTCYSRGAAVVIPAPFKDTNAGASTGAP